MQLKGSFLFSALIRPSREPSVGDSAAVPGLVLSLAAGARTFLYGSLAQNYSKVPSPISQLRKNKQRLFGPKHNS